MAKLKVEHIVLGAVGLGVVVIILDFYVLHGRLGIASKLRGILQQLTGNRVNLETPITPAPGGAEGYTGDPEAREEELMAMEDELAAEEPETAQRARYIRARRANRVRIGGLRI